MSLSLSYLNVAFNTNEYSRAKEQSETLFELINNFLLNNSKLIHLDMSGMNLGNNILLIGDSLAKSLTLQAIHLHQNEIPEEVK